MSDKTGKYEGQLLTVAEAANYIHVGKSTLYEYVNENLIECHRLPKGGIRFTIGVLDALLEKSKVPAVTVNG